MQGPNPYIPALPGAELDGQSAPGSVTWLRVFSGISLLFMWASAGFGLFLMLENPGPSHPGDPPPWLFGAAIMAGYGLLGAPYLLGVFGGRQPWMWWVAIGLTVMSFTCGGCWPLGVAVLVQYLQTPTRAWYGKS